MLTDSVNMEHMKKIWQRYIGRCKFKTASSVSYSIRKRHTAVCLLISGWYKQFIQQVRQQKNIKSAIKGFSGLKESAFSCLQKIHCYGWTQWQGWRFQNLSKKLQVIIWNNLFVFSNFYIVNLFNFTSSSLEMSQSCYFFYKVNALNITSL